MASSTRKTKPQQTGSIINFFPTFRETFRGRVTTSDVKPYSTKLKRFRNFGGIDYPNRHTVSVDKDSKDIVHTPSTGENGDVNWDVCLPATEETSRSEGKYPRKCHLQSTSENLSNLSSHAAPKDRKCTGSVYSERHSKAKTIHYLSQTPRSTKTNLNSSLQGKKYQATHKSCKQVTPKEQSKLQEKPDTQDIDSVYQLPVRCAQPGGHVLQMAHADILLWSLPWPVSPLLRNFRQPSDPLWSSSGHWHPADWHSFTTQSFPTVNRQRRSRWRPDMSEDILKQLLEEIKVANPMFPIQRFFTVLTKKRLKHEKILGDQAPEGCTHSPKVHCLRGKRKLKPEGLSPGLSPKRRRANERPTGPSLDMLGHTPRKPVCWSRLSRTRKRRQQQEKASPSVASSVTMNQWDTTGEKTGNITRLFHEIQQVDDVLWTEKYQPQHSTEVVGNPGGVKKLHTWLKEWKLKADKEERKKKKEEVRRKNSNGSWDSGDFEGEVVLEDCEVDLGTALLITGPQGVGKTAAVYACAQELGFKVFEVNASSQRSGRLLLAQLKEATQSHQVGTPTACTLKPTYFTSHNSAGCSAKPTNSPQKANSSKKVVTLTRRQPSTLRKSSLRKPCSTSVDLTHFFQKTNKADNPKQNYANHTQHGDVHNMETSSGKHEAQDLQTIIIDEEDDPLRMTKAGKLTLMSLILFEEVDVIFSEDVGFLSAIKTFMSTTKRPVVLTTTDPLFGGKFDTHLKELHFKKPPMRVVCSYLQLVCLVENVRTDPQDISSLPAAQTGDIRQCLLQLQFWVQSGGGPTAPLPLNHPVMSQCLPYGGAWLHTEVESVQSADLVELLHDTGCSGACWEFLAVRELSRMFKTLTWNTSEHRRCLEILSESQQRGIDLLYLNMETLLPLPTTTSSSPNDCLKSVSNSGMHEEVQAKELPEPSLVVDKSPGERLPSKPRKRCCLSLKGLQRSKPHSAAKTETSSHLSQSERCTRRHLGEKKTSSMVMSCLLSLAEFLDNLSTLDCYLQNGHVRSGHCTPDLFSVPTRAELRDGMLDEEREEEPVQEQMWRHKASDLRAAVEGMSFRGCCVEMVQAMARAQRLGEEVGADQCKQVLEQLTLPPPPHTHGLLSNLPTYTETNTAERRAELIKTVLCSKSFNRHGSAKVVITDYLPCLRTICKSENLQDKNKTRHSYYPHYLKSIQLGLSKNTLQQLSEDFP